MASFPASLVFPGSLTTGLATLFSWLYLRFYGTIRVIPKLKRGKKKKKGGNAVGSSAVVWEKPAHASARRITAGRWHGKGSLQGKLRKPVWATGQDSPQAAGLNAVQSHGIVGLCVQHPNCCFPDLSLYRPR